MLPLPNAVTFDCWSTLIHESSPGRGPGRRIRILAAATGTTTERASKALAIAWREHQRLWHGRVAYTARDMTRRALAELGTSLSDERTAALQRALEDDLLERDVRVVPGARELLEGLAGRKVRRALVCDTGFAPGRVVRSVLDRVGLLTHLEATIFSDEVGVPKPAAEPFRAALDALGATPHETVHVGDLLRSDVAGGRAMGMGTIRITAHHDDASPRRSSASIIGCGEAGCDPPCPRPEADHVVNSYAELARGWLR
jgi:FMN phosphatase YigB (HAD superfamily)